MTHELDVNMLLQGYRACLCLLEAWQTAHLVPMLLPQDGSSLVINLPKSSLGGSPLLPFSPHIACVQALDTGLSWKLSSQSWGREAGYRGVPEPLPARC